MAPPRGNPRGQQGSARGRGGGVPTQSRGPAQNILKIPDHVKTIGEKRTGFGKLGRQISVTTNHFPCEIPEGVIHHYDGNDPHISSVILPHSKSYSLSFS